MNWDQIEGNWMSFTGRFQQRWGDLTDDEVEKVKGKQAELIGLIQEKYGKTREEAKRELDAWIKSL